MRLNASHQLELDNLQIDLKELAGLSLWVRLCNIWWHRQEEHVEGSCLADEDSQSLNGSLTVYTGFGPIYTSLR